MSHKTKNAPEPAATGIEGSDQRSPSKEKNLMEPMVDQPTDSAPVDLDAVLPRVSPKSPYGRAVKRQYEAQNHVTHAKLRETLFSQNEVPVWHDYDYVDDMEFTFSTPSGYSFVSAEYTALLRNHEGLEVNDGLECAKYVARLVHNVNHHAPMIEGWLTELITRADGSEYLGRVEKSAIRMTLDEATEIAQLLLLLVDVARDPAGRGGE